MEGDRKTFISPERDQRWMPVDMYIGGPEHACMHLIYARFIMMAMKDLGIVKESEPFKRLIHQGLITNQGAKMSKSKGNVVSPDSYVDKYGSDVFRIYLMFMGPFTDGGDWSDSGITGVARFVDRFYTLVSGDGKVTDEKEMLKAVHKAIKKVSEDIEKFQFNTCVAALMEFVNSVSKTGMDSDSKKLMVRLIAPLAPHLAEELWEAVGEKYSVKHSQWPSYDGKYLIETTLKIAVQVNGKLRGEISIDANDAEVDIVAAAKADPNVMKFLDGAELVKEIYVKGKLVSLVVKPK
jgi:leucyl-tRNA synthetase